MISEEIREARRNGLGGSDIAGIIPCKGSPTGTLSPWMTQVQVWNSKVHPELESREETEAMWWGSEEESLNAKRFTQLTGKRLVNYNRMIRDGVLLANVDRLIVPDGKKIAAYRSEIRTDELFEAKNSGSEWDFADAVSILSNGVEILDGRTGVPAYYQTQGNNYMGRVPSAERIFFGVKFCIPVGRFCMTKYGIYVLERNDEIIRAQDAYARSWWEEHVVKGVMPDAVCEEDCKILWRRSLPSTRVYVNRSILSEYAKMRKAVDDGKDAKRREEEAKSALKKAMGENEAIVGDDGETVLATWKSSSDRTVVSTDWEKVAREVAGCYGDGEATLAKKIAEFTRSEVKEGGRKFLLKTSDSVSDYVARKAMEDGDSISECDPTVGSTEDKENKEGEHENEQ